jgi:hypothetical protein
MNPTLLRISWFEVLVWVSGRRWTVEFRIVSSHASISIYSPVVVFKRIHFIFTLDSAYFLKEICWSANSQNPRIVESCKRNIDNMCGTAKLWMTQTTARTIRIQMNAPQQMVTMTRNSLMLRRLHFKFSWWWMTDKEWTKFVKEWGLCVTCFLFKQNWKLNFSE